MTVAFDISDITVMIDVSDITLVVIDISDITTGIRPEQGAIRR